MHGWKSIAQQHRAAKILKHGEPDMMLSTCNLDTQETEAEGSRVQGSLGYTVKPFLNILKQNKLHCL